MMKKYLFGVPYLILLDFFFALGKIVKLQLSRYMRSKNKPPQLFLLKWLTTWADVIAIKDKYVAEGSGL